MRPKIEMGWLVRHTRLLSYTAGSFLIGIWTILRFCTQRTIFDLVGQQVLAGQWLQGHMSGASLGVTNYIPKIFLLYMPLHVLPGSPRLKLIVLTLIINIVTFVLLGLILERILRSFGVRVGGALYAGLLWLSAVAGSVFWIQFTNSRNLEVAGGLFLVYMGLRFLERPAQGWLVGLAAFAALLFFADTLQIYMTAVPLLAYGLIGPSKRPKFRRVGMLAGALAIGLIVSKLLFVLVTHLLSVHILQADTGTSLSLHFLTAGLGGTAKALVHLYAGGADAGKLRELCNVLFLLAALGAAGYAAWRRLVPRKLLLLVSCIIVIDCLVYIASGEAQQGSTERYLIMTAPALVLMVGSLQRLWSRIRSFALPILGVFILINAAFLGHALAQSAHHHFSQDAHLASVHRYLTSHPTTLLYGSMDTSLPMAYLYGSDTAAPLPLSCTGTRLVKDSTFYDTSAYRAQEAGSYRTIAVVLDGQTVTNTPNVCSQADVIAQLGRPNGTAATDDGSIVLLYPRAAAAALHY